MGTILVSMLAVIIIASIAVFAVRVRRLERDVDYVALRAAGGPDDRIGLVARLVANFTVSAP